MTATDRLHAVLAALCDTITEADDLVLASGVAQAMDLHALAPLLPVNATDIAIASGLHGLLVDGNDGAELADADRAVACRVAARLASTACLLLAVDPERSLSTAEALWSASGKLSGLWQATHKAMREAERADDPIAADTDAAYARVKQRVQAPACPQVGDTIDAKDVPLRTLVECHNKDLVIRMPRGQGWTLDAEGGPAHSGWTWEGGMNHDPPIRVMALNIPADECWRVARMTPAEAREWLAQRVAAQPA